MVNVNKDCEGKSNKQIKTNIRLEKAITASRGGSRPSQHSHVRISNCMAGKLSVVKQETSYHL